MVSYDCLHCGKCCTSFGVCVTPFDILRISKATGTKPTEFLSVIPEPPERERTEPAILMEGQRSLIILKWNGEMVCTFHSDLGCAIYAARPRLCRTYPFNLTSEQLEDMKSRACPIRWLPKDKKVYLKDLREYQKELAAYGKIADEWNRTQGGGLDDYLRFALPKAKKIASILPK